MKKIIFIMGVILVMSGCAASGPKYTDYTAKMGNINGNSARLFVFRTGDTAQYSARAASVKLDGASLGSCEYKGFNVFDISPGMHTLTTDMWDAPGDCNLKIDLSPQTVYYFEIKPREGSLVGGLLGGLLGAAIESAGLECGGAFSIEPVEPDVAISKMSVLNLSEQTQKVAEKDEKDTN